MHQVGRRATCNRGRSGCVVVRDNRILVTGYVGAPSGVISCDDAGHEMKGALKDDGTISQHCIRTTHGEQNAICQAAKLGVSLEGSTLYCKMTPCYVCAKLIINSGIKRVVATIDYHASDETKRIFKEIKMPLIILNKKTQQYKNM